VLGALCYVGGLGSVDLCGFLDVKADVSSMGATDTFYRHQSWEKKAILQNNCHQCYNRQYIIIFLDDF